ncbi:hypothetical protein SH661x_000967 [Planctomicrobium sp. SH661]|uniref:hypothetical protein n=1 Tax=Planctomicrobium sp. SH661 TaxID=3448124 RepID=UPI003F5B0E6D
MSIPRPISRWMLVVCAGWSFAASAFAQTPPGVQPSANSARRMRVIENSAPVEGPLTYTVVGAVLRSGVYASNERSIPLGRLIEFAGGLNPQASSTLRIVRNRDVRFQIQYTPNGPGSNDMLLPGDIVVVPIHPSAVINNDAPDAIMPVACLGLLNRPVVLPLNPAINTVEELARRLGQYPELVRTAQVISPARATQPVQLSSGSVIVFDSRIVDKLPLEQPGFLPELIDLDQSRTSAFPGIMPADVDLPPAVPGAQVVQQVSGDLIAPPSLEFTSAVPMALPYAPSDNLPVRDSATPATVLDFPVSQASGQIPPMPADLAHAIQLFAPSQSDEKPSVIQTRSAEVTVETIDIEPTPASSASAEATPPREISPRSTAEVTGPLTSRSILKASSEAGQSNPIRQATRSNTLIRYVLYCGAAISIVIGLGLLLSVAIGPLEFVRPAETPTRAVDSTPAPQAVAQPEQTRPTVRQGVEGLLKREIPVVEEEVRVPSDWPLHGKVVGHRRIILNSAHVEMNGPHFAKRSRNSDREKISIGAGKASERHLRNSLREICKPSFTSMNDESVLENSDESSINETPVTPASGAKPPTIEIPTFPVERTSAPAREIETVSAPHLHSESPSRPADIMEFDIVQPPNPAPVQTAAMSPLERALRTLASEKRG